LFHHERFDGQGYPMRLQGLEIPIQGRILAVADTFDAIVSDRPYRRGRSPETAVQELKDHRGSQFDPEIVDIFLKVYAENRTLIAKLYGNLRSSKNLRELINEF
ncbi:MAG TPA: HD domain-containing phosphohydrolase, partial [candidate division Zixibacteria bacterium]|nr:HD domain-containing phosphohydrolase [candidate division Zixibacteria bacterium]